MPHEEYTRRLTERRGEVARLAQVDEKISRGRLATFIVGVGLWWVAIGLDLLTALWLVVPVVAFIALVLAHERVRQASRLATRSVRFYEQGLARLEDRWIGLGEEGLRFVAPSHPYAQDLDLFGRGSLFALLCTARTQGGEQTLADWLRAPASPDEIRARQAAVEELRGRLDLREQLALRGEDVRASVHPDTLITWAQMSVQVTALRRVRLIVLGLALANVTTLVGWLGCGMSPLLFIAALVVSGVVSVRLRPALQRLLADVAQAERDLPLLAEILGCFEAEQFVCPKLRRLRAALDTNGTPPSRQIARLGRLINLLESGKNQIFIPIAALLLWPVQTALAIEAWRIETGASIARWLVAMSELEALCALAGYAYEHPHDPFPEIVTAEACFVGEDVGHPLIPDARCVRNSVRLEQPLQVLVVSGSNMSGKSTLLRTVGINAVLAFAGAPVRARRLRLSPLAVGATLRIQDSLQEGSSRFYAEVTRLGQLLTLAKGPIPLLFLLDEILHGTNSHDRQVGAEAIVRGFIERGALGLVTTHDLALARIAEVLAPRTANVCFEDHFENGKLIFDYRMRPGVVQKSNALALMRSVGLEV
ncbi:MAG: MutS-related protein [Candidatus Binatia bacterium]